MDPNRISLGGKKYGANFFNETGNNQIEDAKKLVAEISDQQDATQSSFAIDIFDSDSEKLTKDQIEKTYNALAKLNRPTSQSETKINIGDITIFMDDFYTFRRLMENDFCELPPHLKSWIQMEWCLVKQGDNNYKVVTRAWVREQLHNHELELNNVLRGPAVCNLIGPHDE